MPRSRNEPFHGTRVVRLVHTGCNAGGAVEHLRVVGNGDYWPGGQSYARAARVGGTNSRELDTAPGMLR